MDQDHRADKAAGAGPAASGEAAARDSGSESAPRDDDERFIVGLVLTYYRRHPQKARTRLLDLLGEVLVPEPAAGPVVAKPSGPARPAPPGGTAPATRAPAAPAEDPTTLWMRSQTGVAPLKRKR